MVLLLSYLEHLDVSCLRLGGWSWLWNRLQMQVCGRHIPKDRGSTSFCCFQISLHTSSSPKHVSSLITFPTLQGLDLTATLWNLQLSAHCHSSNQVLQVSNTRQSTALIWILDSHSSKNALEYSQLQHHLTHTHMVTSYTLAPALNKLN